MRTSIFLIGLFFLFPLQVLGAGVLINEVLFNPTGDDTGQEWLEVYNSGDTALDLSGWQLYPDGIGYFSFPASFNILPKSFAVVHLRQSGVNSNANLYFNSASTTSNMGNTSGSAALFSGEPRGKDTLKSFVQWGKVGETWENAAFDAGLWSKGTFVDIANLHEGNSIALVSDGVASGAYSWKIVSSPTPGALNVASYSTQTSAGSTASPSVYQNNTSQNSGPRIEPAIKAYAGEDKTAVAGADVDFSGKALGLANEPLENARFWWNFGDGGTKEGKTASHIFQIPGKYLIGFHVSSGEYSSSDYLTLNAIPNQLAIINVISGTKGFIELKNPTDTFLDIGEWAIEDGNGKRFVIPSLTKIGAEAEVALANSTTGLLQEGVSALKIFYPNSTLALEWNGKETIKKDGGKIKPFLVSNSGVSNPVIPVVLSSGSSSPKSVAENTDRQFASVAKPVFKSRNFFLILAAIFSIIGAVGFFFSKRLFF